MLATLSKKSICESIKKKLLQKKKIAKIILRIKNPVAAAKLLLKTLCTVYD